MARFTSDFRAYLAGVRETFRTEQATEHSYRGDLQTLLEAVAGAGVRAINEPKHVAVGAPDIVVTGSGGTIGHIECKNIGVSLTAQHDGRQLVGYRHALPNLILTDYLEFHWFRNGTLVETASLGVISRDGSWAARQGGVEEVEQLLGAFSAVEPAGAETPEDLAVAMAAQARLLRSAVERALDENHGGQLSHLYEMYKDTLFDAVTHEQFADMQAQTVAYGLFAARCLQPHETFSRQTATFAQTTPFLRDMFSQIAGPAIDGRITWIVDAIADLLEATDFEGIIQSLATVAGREESMLHFYETFLAAYNPRVREMRGVYFTPRPVVSYIVRSVDRILRSTFGLPLGFAATEQLASPGPSAEPQMPRVLILDPATGTGTFLNEVVDLIRATITEEGMEGAWESYVQDHLLPRLLGFELLMAPYVICHLRLALALGGPDMQMPDGERLHVYLTNALEPPQEGDHRMMAMHAIEQEARGADAVKRERPVMVVLGNPPYSGHSANQGEWISALMRGDDAGDATHSYFTIGGEPLGEPNPKWLNDDYVKFIRYAQRRIEQTGSGVVAFITNHSYLANPTFRGMREALLESFDEIYIVNLHGNTLENSRELRALGDENVFDIQQGVAISIFVRHEQHSDHPAKVWYAERTGPRGIAGDSGKLEWLARESTATTDFEEVRPVAPLLLFKPVAEDAADEFRRWPQIIELFEEHSVGIATARDNLTVQMTREDMEVVLRQFAEMESETAREEFALGRDTRDWQVELAQLDIEENSGEEMESPLGRVLPYRYRPFDHRWTWYSGRSRGFHCMPRRKVMNHLAVGDENIALLVGRQGQVTGSPTWDLAFAAEGLIDLNVFRRGSTQACPLYRLPLDDEGRWAGKREANISADFCEAIGAATGLRIAFNRGREVPGSEFSVRDVFNYIYAVLQSRGYRERYHELLQVDYPRIPTPGSAELFRRLATVGAELVQASLLREIGGEMPRYATGGANKIERVRFVSGDGVPSIEINAEDKFTGIPVAVWEFTIGGRHPVRDWLEARKGSVLVFDDVLHFRRMCAAIGRMIELADHVDEIIEAHGGWPIDIARGAGE